MVRAGQPTRNRRFAKHSETDRASDRAGPAKIRFAPVSLETRPNAAAEEPCRQRNVVSFLPVAPREPGAHRSADFVAKPKPLAARQKAGYENIPGIPRARFFLLSPRSEFVAQLPSST